MAQTRTRRSLRTRRTRRRARPRRTQRSAGIYGITQGTGRTTKRGFGTRRRTRRSFSSMSLLASLDAFSPSHLPLPRATGPYSVVRTSAQVSTSDRLMLIGPMVASVDNPLNPERAVAWTNAFMYSMDDLTDAINGTNTQELHTFRTMDNNSWTSATLVPAAMTIQVMNPQALQTTTGICYMGRFHTIPGYTSAVALTAQTLADNFVSYNAPRLCSAGKLALRGVKCSGVPYNMSELSNFTELYKFGNVAEFTLGTGSPRFEGFAPLCIYNPEAVTLNLLICCEWRVRFDPTNPAQATHRHHTPASDSLWSRTLNYMNTQGHGFADMAETAAQAIPVLESALRLGRGAVDLLG